MKAVIMCGGVGSRLRPLTETTPKPLIRLMNVPILTAIVSRLTLAGIKDISLALGYRAQDIIEFCERKPFDAMLHYYTEEKPLGTAGGVKNCLHDCSETVLVLSGDNVFDIDLKAAAEYHRLSGADATIIGVRVKDPREYGVIVTDEDQNIVSFQEKPSWENAADNLINTGIYLIEPEIIKMIPENTAFDFSDGLFPELLRQHKKFKCWQTDAFWGDIGEFEAYLQLTQEILREHTDDFPYQGTLYLNDTTDAKGNTVIAPSLIGDKAVFGKNNTVGPFAVIGKNLTLEDGCTLNKCVIGDDAKIESGTELSGAVVDDGVRLRTNCVIERNAVLGYGTEIGRFSRVTSESKIWPGRKISAENVISGEVFYETPEKIETDVYGVTGKIFSQLSLSDAVKLGQALASEKTMERIGVGCDGTGKSELYKSVMISGVRSCGVICYDFEHIIKAQAWFYSAYCNLDAFVYISVCDLSVNFSFFGKNGLPVTPKTARNVNNNYRYSSFDYCYEEPGVDLFRMNLLSTAYTAALHKTLNCNISKQKIRIECENKVLREYLNDFFCKLGAADAPGGIQFLINAEGTDMYCIQNEIFYSSERIRAALCELSFAQGKDVIIREDAVGEIDKIASKYKQKAIRLLENNENPEITDRAFLDNLWNFDAVFLCVKLLSVIVSANISIEELLSVQNDFVLRKRIVELDCPPEKIRTMIEETGAKKGSPLEHFYIYHNSKGTARIRQLGNENRLKILVEAADTETAKEMAGELLSKFKQTNLDNDLI